MYPVLLIKFWYIDATKFFLHVYKAIFTYCIYLFSLPLLVRTFFKPLKNEYRGELIVFSIVFGMVVKTFLILFSLLVIGIFALLGALFLIAFWTLPYLLLQLLTL
jgi:hypothetical protein